MSRILAELLGVDQALLAADIKQLEQASGHHSIDIRLSTELTASVRRKTRELGLDPKDSTGSEIYHGLINLAKLHDEFLARRAGGDVDQEPAQLLPKLINLAKSTKGPKAVWALKHSAAKQLLKQSAPRKTMKYLGYRSIDSLLKRLPMAEIYAGIHLVETDEWRQKFIAKYAELSPMDFETRPIEIVMLDSKRWAKAAAGFVQLQRHIITAIQELGAILVLPAPLGKRPGLSLVVVPQLLNHINELRLQAAHYKLQQMQPDFGRRMVTSLMSNDSQSLFLAGQRVHWRVVQRHFGRHEVPHPEVLEPHVQPDDFSWHKVESVLFRVEPALHFWHDTDYVALPDGLPVSLNLMDAGICLYNQLSYEDRVYGHFQGSLWNELFARYMGTNALEQQVLRQLDHGNHSLAEIEIDLEEALS